MRRFPQFGMRPTPVDHSRGPMVRLTGDRYTGVEHIPTFLQIHHGAFIIGAALLLSGCGIDLQVHKGTVDADEKAPVTARLRAPAATTVNFKIAAGEECGSLSAVSAASTAAGTATVIYTGATGVEDCAVTIEATADVPSAANAGGSAAARHVSGSASFYVNKQPLTKARIDGVSMLTLFFIASFAIDRTVRGVLFALSFFAFWRRWVPDEASPGDAAAEKKQRLAYTLMAGALAILVLGWFGKVRILAGLGFAQVHPVIDTLFTGLLLVGGAERTDALLKAIGAGSGAEMGKDAPRPVEISGRLVLDNSQAQEKPAQESRATHA